MCWREHPSRSHAPAHDRLGIESSDCPARAHAQATSHAGDALAIRVRLCSGDSESRRLRAFAGKRLHLPVGAPVRSGYSSRRIGRVGAGGVSKRLGAPHASSSPAASRAEDRRASSSWPCQATRPLSAEWKCARRRAAPWVHANSRYRTHSTTSGIAGIARASCTNGRGLESERPNSRSMYSSMLVTPSSRLSMRARIFCCDRCNAI